MGIKWHGILLTMGNAGYIPSAVVGVSPSNRKGPFKGSRF